MATQKGQGNLDDFEFDNDQKFFGQEGGDTPGIKSGANNGLPDDEDDDLEDGTTSFEEDDKDSKADKAGKIPGKKEDEEEAADVKFFADPAEEDDDKDDKGEGKETKKPVVKKKAGEEADATDEEDNDDPDDKTVKAKKKPEEKDDDNTGKEETDKEFFTTLAVEMKEKGVFQFAEIKEGEEIDEERFLELQDEELDGRLNATLTNLFKGLDDDGKSYIKHIKDGGNTASFIQIYGSEIDLEGINTDNEAERDALIRYYLTSVDEKDAEETEELLKFYKDGGKDKANADKYLTVLKKAKEKRVKAYEDGEVERKTKAKAAAQEFFNSLVETAEKTEKLAGIFSLTKEDKKKLPAFIHKASIRVGDDRYVPPFQVKLAQVLKAKTKEDKEKLLLLGKILESDFDFSDVIPAVATKVATKVKSKLREAKNGSVRATSAGGYGTKSLTDYEF